MGSTSNSAELQILTCDKTKSPLINDFYYLSKHVLILGMTRKCQFGKQRIINARTF